jgi:hypothetical protein
MSGFVATDVLRRLDLGHDSDLADQILRGLKDNPRVVGTAAGPVYAPFPDIMVQTAGGLSAVEEKQLNINLVHGCDGFGRDIRLSTFSQPGLASGEVFFGRGVYCRNPQEMPVARIDLTGVDPALPASRRVASPALPDGSPAGWYEGQRGLAFGFVQGLAPATASLTDLNAASAARLADVIVCIDIHDAGKNRQLKAFRYLGGNIVETGLNILADQTVLDSGGWVPLDLEGVQLWLRFVNYATFRVAGAPAAAAAPSIADPSLRIFGLVLPELRGRLNFLQKKPRGWRVDFDRAGQLRHSELQSLSHTAYTQLERFSVYDHAGQSAGRVSADGSRRYSISNGRQVLEAAVERLPLDARYRELARMLGNRASLIGLTPARDPNLLPLGEVPLGPMPADGQMRVLRLSAEPQEPQRFHEAVRDGEGELSLDWINRAAKVEADAWIGLAEFWLRRATILLKIGSRARPNGSGPSATLQVEVLPIGKPQKRTIDIAPGAIFAAGPFLAQYLAGG